MRHIKLCAAGRRQIYTTDRRWKLGVVGTSSLIIHNGAVAASHAVEAEGAGCRMWWTIIIQNK
eukprot:scaffold3587_cov151-Skeletonema_marinoi.AAC.6